MHVQHQKGIRPTIPKGPIDDQRTYLHIHIYIYIYYSIHSIYTIYIYIQIYINNYLFNIFIYM